mmetsp:Transcript_61207/g.101844  ORF Transcript_61207/g.101844 Transcript_61207/m.101844 type:complete len:219 (-) Transcript_61207:197-853(-)
MPPVANGVLRSLGQLLRDPVPAAAPVVYRGHDDVIFLRCPAVSLLCTLAFLPLWRWLDDTSGQPTTGTAAQACPTVPYRIVRTPRKSCCDSAPPHAKLKHTSTNGIIFPSCPLLAVVGYAARRTPPNRLVVRYTMKRRARRCSHFQVNAQLARCGELPQHVLNLRLYDEGIYWLRQAIKRGGDGIRQNLGKSNLAKCLVHPQVVRDECHVMPMIIHRL